MVKQAMIPFLIMGLFFTGIYIVVQTGLIIYADDPEMLSSVSTVFLVGGIATFIGFIVCVFMLRATNTIKRDGTDAVGTYIKHYSNSGANGIRYYKIVYSYVNMRGETIEVKSPSEYRRWQAENIGFMGTFPIKYLDDKAVIMLDRKQING